MAARKKAAKKAAKKVSRVKKARRTAVKRSPARLAAPLKGLSLESAGPSYTVDDVEKSLAFYRDVLDCAVGERWEREGRLLGVELKAGKVSIWISQDDWKKGHGRPKGEGFRIYCETRQDVDRLAAGIKTRGGSLAEEPHDEPWGGRSFTVVDPDGFKLTITS